jgi:hypothetical protein
MTAALPLRDWRNSPVPFTLTSKAHAALAALDDDPGPAADEWGCDRCGDAYFGTPPDDGLCGPCRGGHAVPAVRQDRR